MEDSLTSARERAGEDAIQFQDRQGGAGRQSALPADIPADWVPTAADVAWARSRCPNLDILAFTENFVLACCAKGYRYADASAAWRKWLVEPKGRLPTIELRPGASRLHPHTGAGQGRGGPPLAERNAAIAQACLDRINARRGL
jgi:hypothetical protein